MTEPEKERSWFRTLPGLISAIAVIVAAITSLATFLFSQPEINFDVTPLKVKQGERVSLKWGVKKARQVIISPDIGVDRPAVYEHTCRKTPLHTS